MPPVDTRNVQDAPQSSRRNIRRLTPVDEALRLHGQVGVTMIRNDLEARQNRLATLLNNDEAQVLSSIREFINVERSTGSLGQELRAAQRRRREASVERQRQEESSDSESMPELFRLPSGEASFAGSAYQAEYNARTGNRSARSTSMSMPAVSAPTGSSEPTSIVLDGIRSTGLVQTRHRQRNRENTRTSSTSTRMRAVGDAYGNTIPMLRPGEPQSLYDWAPLSFSPSTELRDLNEAIMSAGLTTPEELRDILTQHGIIGRDQLLPRAPSPPASAPAETRTAPSRDRIVRLPWIRYGGETSHTSSRRRTAAQSSSSSGSRWPAWYDLHREGSTNDGLPETFELPPLTTRPHRRGAAGRPVEEAIKYLTKIRDDPRRASDDHFPEREPLSTLHDEELPVEDFLIDTSFFTVPATSWLAIGGIFKGSQYAAQSPAFVSRRLTSPTTAHAFDSLVPHTFLFPTSTSTDVDGVLTTTDAIRKLDDKWDVEVNIHSINYHTMQITGSMQAFEIPDWQAPNGKSSINTYWEGEVVDFQRHGLETLNFTSTPQIDGTYWRKLAPFAGYTDNELAQKLVSKKFLRELSERWILMRWKEKCFVTPSTDTGLTISGFYYLCLDRANGQIEGFYFDPASSPYQQLSLKPAPKVFTTYQFR